MTQEAPWMGVTPDPPTGSTTPCTSSGGCSATQHFASCPVVVREVHRNEAKRACSNSGHDWMIFRSGDTGRPWKAHCDRCGLSLRMVEEE